MSEEAFRRIAELGARAIQISLRLPSQTKQLLSPELLTEDDKKALKDWDDLQKEAQEQNIEFPG